MDHYIEVGTADPVAAFRSSSDAPPRGIVCFQIKKYVQTLKGKVKVWTFVIAPLTRVRLATSSALQSRKWQLIGMSQWCRSALCGHPLPALTDNWTHCAASRHTIAPISHTRPSPHSPQLILPPVRRVVRSVHSSSQQSATVVIC